MKFDDFLNEELKNEEFKKAYDALETEYQIAQAIIDARKARGLTQKNISERTGMAQGDVSKIENCNANPSIKTLEKIAKAMDMKIKIEFVPIEA